MTERLMKAYKDKRIVHHDTFQWSKRRTFWATRIKELERLSHVGWSQPPIRVTTCIMSFILYPIFVLHALYSDLAFLLGSNMDNFSDELDA